MTVYQEDVKRTLMVGHKHVTLVLLQILAPFHLDGQKKQFQDQVAPPVTRVVAPEMPLAEWTAHSGDDSGDEGGNQPQWQGDEQLINVVYFLKKDCPNLQ